MKESMGKAILLLMPVALLMMGSLASSAMAQGDSILPRGVVIVKVGDGTYVSGVAIQKDGKILVSATSFLDNQGQSILIRRNADGSVDRTFGKAGMVTTELPGFYIQPNGMALQEDGKTVIAGRVIPLKEKNKWTGRTSDDLWVIRHNPDGQLDKGFNHTGWVKTDIDGDIDVAYGLALQRDRKIVVIGNTSKWIGYHFATIRYNEDGSLDRGFGKRGKAITRVGSAREDSARAVAIQADGKIIVAGGADDYPRYGRVMALVRYKPDGGLDPRFGFKGKVLKHFEKGGERDSSIANAVTIQPDGKIIAGINVYSHGSHWIEGRLIRLNTDGGFDGTFGNGGSVTVNRHGYSLEAVGAVALHSDGKILFVGSAYNREKANYAIIVGRNNADGSPDTSFGNKGITEVLMGKSFAAGRKIALQSDGKIVVAGDVGMIDPNAISHRSSRYPSDLVIFRLNAAGRIDENLGAIPK